MHALQLGRLRAVDLHNDLVGLFEPGLVVADRGRRNQPAVFKHADHFDDGEVHVAEEPVPGVLGNVAEVDVDVVQFAGVDPLAQRWIGLVGQAQLHAVHFGQRAVELRGG